MAIFPHQIGPVPWTWSKPNVVGQKEGSPTRNALVIKAKAVVIRAIKHPQNNFISGWES
jgi:hypothetical protein